MADELRIRRLKLWQTVARDPKEAVQVLAAVFGTTKIEEQLGINRLAADGTLGDEPTPWALQLREDLERMSCFEDGDCKPNMQPSKSMPSCFAWRQASKSGWMAKRRRSTWTDSTWGPVRWWW